MNPTPPSSPRDLEGREVLVCVCGGVAAYKTCEVVSKLVQRGAGVTVAMSRAARKFVGRATFEALTARRVLTGLWDESLIADSPHIRATAETDAALVAPATANIIGKIAGGLADDIVSTLVMSTVAPVVVAPAMNDRMWNNLFVQANVRRLREAGYTLVGPGEGWLACRSLGAGRMAEPAEIIDAVVAALHAKKSA